MSNRIKGFIVTLDQDFRDDDAESIKQAILALRYVQDVAPVAVNSDDYMNRVRVRYELEEKLLNVIREA